MPTVWCRIKVRRRRPMGGAARVRATQRFVRDACAFAFAVSVLPAACGGDAVSDSPRSESAGGVGSADADAGASDNTGFCAPYCATRADCCSECTYPDNLDCRDRHCVSLGCTGDADCTRADGPETVCRTVAGMPGCIEPCQVDGDCSDQSTCAGRDDRGESYCARLPVLLIPCFEDSDCVGRGVCDEKKFSCGCSLDAECPAGSVCVSSS
jgi:hypothetical protein